jgi:outer membrane protein OmpA-like peptidoglycan-associated protein
MYFTAKSVKGAETRNVAVLVVESGGTWWPIGGNNKIVIKDGEILVSVDLVTSKSVGNNMVELKAADMAKAIAATGKVDIYGIYFDVDKTAIKPESAPTLEQVAQLMKDDPALKLIVAGHTDNTGAARHNMELSEGRAAAVVKALTTTYGVTATRLQPKGFGDTQPVAPNATEDDRAKNRRVELRKL